MSRGIVCGGNKKNASDTRVPTAWYDTQKHPGQDIKFLADIIFCLWMTISIGINSSIDIIPYASYAVDTFVFI